LRKMAGLAGLLHDLGKYGDGFQDYIRKAAFCPELAEINRGQIDHSTAGGKLLFSIFHDNGSFHGKLLAEIVGNAIISHHANLQDYISPSSESDYLRRVRDKEIPEFETIVDRFFGEVITKAELIKYAKAALDELEKFTDNSPTQSFFLTKLIFSCLLDADRTNTRQFEEQTRELELERERPQCQQLFNIYYQRLMRHLAALKEKKDASEPINLLRSAMSEECEQFAKKPSGIYTLSIPTGGGKTLASLRYALRHLQEYGKQRIIYVVPFTTIIEQNAQEVREILEDDENILEHHSNVVEDNQDNNEMSEEQYDGLITKKTKLKLARDNWDSPIIFTTSVQFLNVFYAKGNRNTRRLHNLSHSVIIFDEVQKVPTKCVSLFNEALNFLKEKAYCSILLCTATQPTLEHVKHALLKAPEGEIVPQLADVNKAFKRVEIVDKTDRPMTNKQLAKWISADATAWGSTLVVLNTKTVVKDLYKRLKGGPLPVYHLSTSMCAAHRKERIDKIRKLLVDGIPFICVTTQLIEAGVDISFKCVIRSLAGLDSIAQAAGRCNRHGEDVLQYVYVIDHAEERLANLPEIEIGKGISANIFARFKKKADSYDGDLLSEKAMREYFSFYYKKMDTSLNYYVKQIDREMTKLLFSLASENSYVTHHQKKKGKPFPLLLNGSYKTAVEYFHVIEQKTTSVIVPYVEGKELIAELNSSERIDDLTRLFRKAQQYTVDIYRQNFNLLKKQGALVGHLDETIYELKEGWYSDEYGVDLQGEGGMEYKEW
ncbi:MAG TPA: CRISPR-associated helicase Cas3', partial [Firmicutes bacterium]|nr:CRISPR-associated helicase Cas3' [Bacillota bacterium]